MKKQGVSQMIEYVMVIVVVLALALLLYFYLSSYVPVEAPACPDGVGLVVEHVTCTNESAIAYTLVNEGLFTIDGIHVSAGSAYRVVRNVLNEDSNFQIFNDSETDGKLAPGERVTYSYNYSDPERTNEVVFQPIMYGEDNTPSLCSAAAAKEKVYCNVCFNGEVNDGEAYDNDTLLGIIEVYPPGASGSGSTGTRYTNETVSGTVFFPAVYEARGIVGRGDPTNTGGPPSICTTQLNETFHLEINGIHGPNSPDPNNATELVLPSCSHFAYEVLGVFPLTVGGTNITVWSDAQPLTASQEAGNPGHNSVDIAGLCVYEIPPS